MVNEFAEVCLCRESNAHSSMTYRIAGKFGGVFNLAIWRSGGKSPN